MQERAAKFATMVEAVRTNAEARDRLLREPERVLAELGIDRDALNQPHDEGALGRAREALSAAALSKDDDAISALRKVGSGASKAFKTGFEVEVEPFGVTLLERTKGGLKDWTATGTVKCTWGPWDGCNPDVDW